MPLKPIHQRDAEETREAIWQAIRETRGVDSAPNRPFTAAHLWQQTGASRATVTEYLTGLHRAGYITAVGKEAGKPGKMPATIYRLIRDHGVEPPRVRRDGTAVTMGMGRENMWRTMRIMGEFTARELAISATTEEVVVAESEARTYCYHLHKAGYLATIGERSGRTGLTCYRLLQSRYSGPKPPMVQRVRQVYDPNTRTVVWTGGAE